MGWSNVLWCKPSEWASARPNPKLFIWVECLYFTTHSQSVLKCRIKTHLGVRKILLRGGMCHWIIFKPVTLHFMNCMVSDSSWAWFCPKKGQRPKYDGLNPHIKIRGDLFWETKWGWFCGSPLSLLHKTAPAWHWQRPHLTFDLVPWPRLRFFCASWPICDLPMAAVGP